jgi:small-conductance mechanosensitive channel
MTGRLRVGDYIECDGISGKVESITYQSTQVITADGCVIAFLNKALFSKNFKNLTRNHNYEQICIPVGVAYGTDVQAVRRILTEALKPLCEERNSADVPMTDPERPVDVRFSDFGDSSVDLKVYVWMLVEGKYAFTGRVKEAIYNALNANNIEIPFPQRDVHLINEK